MTEQKEYIFTVGCDLSDGRRFEAKRKVPKNIKADDFSALLEMGAIVEKPTDEVE